MKALEPLRQVIRRGMRGIARGLHVISGGRLSPDTVTIFGCLMHIPIALLIATDDYRILAAVLLIIFGLFDTLDGELARLQGRSSVRGMLLDASTDRMKEVLLYAGIAYAFALSSHPATAAWAAGALGASLCVSYVKAKGEAAVASGSKEIPHDQLNKMFKDGLLTFEIRIALLVAGLLFNQLLVAVIFIATLASWTALQRLYKISKAL